MSEEINTIYEAVVPVNINAIDRETKCVPLMIHLFTQTRTQTRQYLKSARSDEGGNTALPTSLKTSVLCIRLTDEKDPFFLYTLFIGEEDFTVLKNQQDIVVDFATFPFKLVELLESCVKSHGHSEEGVSPQFMALLSLQHAEGELRLVQCTKFKHLDHLKLNFKAGNDSAIKTFLAEKLRSLKDIKEKLELQLTFSQEQLSKTVTRLEAELDTTRAERNEAVKLVDKQQNDMALRHAQEMASLKERYLKIQQEMTAAHDKEKRESEESYQSIINKQQNKLDELTSQNAAITTQKYELESTIRELSTQRSLLQTDNERMNEELQRLRGENRTLDSTKFQHEKSITQSQVRVSALEQQVKDKDEVIAKMTQLLDAANQNKSNLEDALKVYKSNSGTLEDKVKTCVQEINKGNQIIQKLQSELKSMKDKMKLRKQQIQQQDSLLKQQQSDLSQQSIELRSIQEQMKQRDSEISSLKQSISEKNEKLKEYVTIVGKNKETIEYLHKELTEMQRKSRPTFGSSYSVAQPFSLTQSSLNQPQTGGYSYSQNKGLGGSVNHSTAPTSTNNIGASTAAVPILGMSSLSSSIISDTAAPSIQAPLVTRQVIYKPKASINSQS